MQVRYVTESGVADAATDELPALLGRTDGFVWVDIVDWTAADRDRLSTEFGFHPVALDICGTRNHMPMVHGYADHLFLVVHRPVVIGAGQVRPVEITLFLGARYLVTVHPAEHPATGSVSETDETLDRLRGGRIHPTEPAHLMHAIIGLVALRQRLLGQEVARRVGDVESKVLKGAMTDPEASLDEMFMVRYELLSVRTAAAHTEEVMARGRRLLVAVPGLHGADELADLQDLFRRVHRMTTSEQELLAGVIDLYRARTDTKMMIATERLAVLATVTLPITAIASVYGMNVIVNTSTHWGQLIAVLLVMVAISAALLRWTKRLGWW